MKHLHILAGIILAAGCTTQNNPNNVTRNDGRENGPWTTILGDDDYGGIQHSITFNSNGEDFIEYEVDTVHFGDLLRDIGEMTNCSVICTDQSLINRGVTVKFSGAGAQALLDDLSSKLNLTVNGTAPSFTLTSTDTSTK